METCIRNNLHEEGLVLLRHANTLYSEHLYNKYAFFFLTTSPTSSESHPSHSGDSIILGIFNDMVAVGEQQEALLLRELETDITVSRCMQILSFLEQNIDLVSTFLSF